MDKDRVAGAGKELKGNIKEAAGKVVGDKKLETEGKIDKVAGKVQNAVGQAKGRGARRSERPLGPSYRRSAAPSRGTSARRPWVGEPKKILQISTLSCTAAVMPRTRSQYCPQNLLVGELLRSPE
ncbi:MAG: CsbD family protein [Pseudomonadota bacterium]